MSRDDLNIDGNECKILCPFCSAPWSDENLKVYNISYDDYESTGPCGFECDIEITCHSCSRLMYKKEGRRIGY